MKTLSYIFILVLLSSCGANYHLRQAKRHLKIAEQKGADISADTIWIDKQVIVPETKYDTVFRDVNFNDTITIVKDKIITKIKINTVTKEVFVQSTQKADTVLVKVPFTVTKEIKAGKSGLELMWWLVAALAVGFFLGRFIR